MPRYLAEGTWSPKETVPTLSNAMDVSRPNNWPRVEELFKVKGWDLKELGYAARSDEETRVSLKKLHAEGYLCEPHGVIAWDVLQSQLAVDEVGIFLCTAHPAKFKESVEEILNIKLDLPKELADRADLPLLSAFMPADFAKLREFLMA